MAQPLRLIMSGAVVGQELAAEFGPLPPSFLPVGTRLHPPLRRETVRRLLADDPDRAIWLSPNGSKGFTPHGVLEDAFRPLDEWVNYVIETNREPIAAWIAATTFDFDSFVCAETGTKPKPPPAKGEEKAVKGKSSPAAAPSKGKAQKTINESPAFSEPEAIPEPIRRTPTEWETRRSELEAAFLGEGSGPLDSPERKKEPPPAPK